MIQHPSSNWLGIIVHQHVQAVDLTNQQMSSCTAGPLLRPVR